MFNSYRVHPHVFTFLVSMRILGRNYVSEKIWFYNLQIGITSRTGNISNCYQKCEGKLLNIYKNVIYERVHYCKNVILLVYLHPKNVIYAKKKDRECSSRMEKQG